MQSVELFSQKKGRSSYQKNSEQQLCNIKLDSANLIFNSNPEKALSFVEEALLSAIKNSFHGEEARAYRTLGDFNFELSEYNLALKNYEKAFSLYLDPESRQMSSSKKIQSSKYNDNYSKSESSMDIDMLSDRFSQSPDVLYELYPKAGKAAHMAGKHAESLGYYKSFLEIAEENNNIDDIVFAKIAIADVFTLQGDFDNANAYYKEVKQVELDRGNKKGEIAINNKLGQLYDQHNAKDSALKYFEQSKEVALEIEDDEAVNLSFNNIASIHKAANDVSNELDVNQQAAQFNTMRSNIPELARNQVEMGEIYIQQDESDKAIELLESGAELSDESGDLETKSKAVKALSEVYEKKGEESDALEKYKEYVQIEDSINERYQNALIATTNTGRLLDNTQNRVLVLEKDKELDEKTIELLRREQKLQAEQIKRQKMINYFLFVGIILLVIASFFVYRSNLLKRKANQLLVLKSLRSQMNPHFIFNALNSVNNYISVNNERAANKYLSDFSKLMRDVLENSSEDFIPLSKEIEILELYLKLEHHRFKDKFEYTFHVDDHLSSSACLIPPMLIQPYIENAVWHGLRYKKEKGKLDVTIMEANGFIEIKVIDDGIGRKKSKEIKTENQKIMKSTGLKNIEERLQVIKEVYGVKLDASISDLNTETKEGTIVLIKLQSNTFV